VIPRAPPAVDVLFVYVKRGKKKKNHYIFKSNKYSVNSSMVVIYYGYEYKALTWTTLSRHTL